MPEAVIVSVARTPIGRAMKGSLKNCRPDDLTAFIVDTALNKIPELDRTEIEDVVGLTGAAGYTCGSTGTLNLSFSNTKIEIKLRH